MSGALERLSAPPARIRSLSPAAMYLYAVSIDCMPEPQLMATVKATVSVPQPSRSAATRPGFCSSAPALTQPRIT